MIRPFGLVAGLAVLCAAGAARGDDLLVRPQGAAPAGGFSFGFAAAPAPASNYAPAPVSGATRVTLPAVITSPLDLRPTPAALAAAVAPSGTYAPKLVDVPSPPRPERAKEDAAAPEPARAAPAPATQAAATGGGFFTWLASLDKSSAEPPQQVASLAAVGRTQKLDLSDPFRPRRGPADNPADDDLEDEETRRTVEKQVDSVEIACLKPGLLRMIRTAGDHFKGTPIITSGFRDRGRRGSHHRKCEAADFFITGVSSSDLTRFLRNLPGAGGVGTYCHTKSVHLDTGEARNWHQCGRRRSFALRVPVIQQIGSR